jgi:hypothetical protein
MKGIQKRPLAVEVFLAGKNLLRTGDWKTPLYTNSTQETEEISCISKRDLREK